MTRVATTELESGDVCFALKLRHLHPDRELDAEAVTRDGVAFVTALEGQRDARFVLQTACFPDPRRPEHGQLAIHLIATLSSASDASDDRIDELCDDLLDLLAAPPVRWSFEPVADADDLAAVLEPFTPAHLAEVARREEPCLPTRWSGGVGFGTDPSLRTADRPLWSMWTLGPASKDLRRLGSVLLAQEAPVCIRVSLTPSAISPEERAGIEALSMNVADAVAGEGLLRASWHTVESLLYLRPLFDVRCVVASPEPLSPSMLSALGHAFSEPPAHGAPEPVLRGGFAVLRGDHEVDREILLDAFRTLSCGNPVPSLAPEGLERIRRLLGPWEASNIFRIPATDEDGFPGLTTLRIPDLEVPLVDLAKSGQVAGHVVGNPNQKVLIDPEERFRHLYVSGQTGTGKSTLLLNLALQDIEAGAGVAVLDPHGDLVEALLGRIPPERADDVVLVDPADPVAVTGVNLLEGETPIQREYVVSELARMFYSLFDPNRTGIIGPRYESWLRQAALLLLANRDEPSSFLDISTVFVDPAVRKHLVDGITDPILAEFWRGEMAQTSDYHKSEVLGGWRPGRKSGWEIDGIHQAVVSEFSQRRNEIDDALAELEAEIGHGAHPDEVEHIVLRTRPAKNHTPADELIADWRARAAKHGLTSDDLDRLTQPVREPDAQRDSQPDTQRDRTETVYRLLAADDGICAGGSVFTRSDAIAAVANVGVPDGDGVAQPLLGGADQVLELTDGFLASGHVVTLTDGDEPLFTTTAMLERQNRIAARFRAGRHEGTHHVSDQHLATALAGQWARRPPGCVGCGTPGTPSAPMFGVGRPRRRW